jgi:hypothetical protein
MKFLKTDGSVTQIDEPRRLKRSKCSKWFMAGLSGTSSVEVDCYWFLYNAVIVVVADEDCDHGFDGTRGPS